MAREKHIEKPVFRLATRLCIQCGRDVVYSVPHATPPSIIEEVIGKAMEEHVCALVPTTRGTWSVRK